LGVPAAAAAGRVAGAAADEAEGLPRPADTESALLARGKFLLGTDPAAALDVFDAVLRRNPRSFTAIRNKVFLLAERLQCVPEAVKLLDDALRAFPDAVPLRMARAVYLARLGRRDDALADAAVCLRDDGSALIEYRVACVYALNTKHHPDDRAEAFRHLAAALRKGYDRFDTIERDADLDALRDGAELGRLVQAARDLRGR